MLLLTVATESLAQPRGNFVRGGGYGDFFLLRNADTPAETIAVGDLFARLWKASTGSSLAIGERNEFGYVNVGLGTAGLTFDVFPRAMREAIGSDGYYYGTYTPSARLSVYGATKYLVIAGNTAESTRAGIYGFFRNVFGCEWYAPGVSVMRRPSFQMEQLSESYRPAFRLREIVGPPSKDPDTVEFRVAHGLRAASLGVGLGRESSLTLVSPEAYFDTHPSYFAEIKGQRRALKELWAKPALAGDRRGELGDLCPSADGLDEVVVAAIREAIDTPPAPGESPALALRRSRAGWLAQEKTWSLSPMRGIAPCECAACRAIAEREASPMAPWLSLVNAVAIKLDAAYPGEGFRVLTHADGSQLVAPKDLRPADNVIVVLSTNRCDFTTALAEGATPSNQAFAAALRDWTRLGDHVWVADCLGYFGKFPVHFGKLSAFQENLQLYTQCHVEGVVMQFLGAQPANDDFSALRSFLAARLLWNPDLDLQALTDSFLEAYYGEAVGPVRDYLQAVGPFAVGGPNEEPSPAQREGIAKAASTLAAARGELPEAVWARVTPLLPAQH